MSLEMRCTRFLKCFYLEEYRSCPGFPISVLVLSHLTGQVHYFSGAHAFSRAHALTFACSLIRAVVAVRQAIADRSRLDALLIVAAEATLPARCNSRATSVGAGRQAGSALHSGEGVSVQTSHESGEEEVGADTSLGPH